jgi:hypothetical protein
VGSGKGCEVSGKVLGPQCGRPPRSSQKDSLEWPTFPPLKSLGESFNRV